MDSSVQHSLWVIVDPPPPPNDKKYKCRLGFEPHFGRFINHPHGLQYTVKICGQILQIALHVYILCMTANRLFLKSDHYTQVP